eukprot:gnl/TRDRNA2_/TRDRNA2_194464_c0_seq1.p2 gnl/TRDRNA2_/TRDRNA2_194464_c0~~gnl/TRDRNA2_/TRDRNA2_194464_c0_seq1.p2  ORF type:complete len:126 (-),score=18.64 gnl/TRDRNA2_/TRDRNA2_194464_c0_seq1:103-480(-)
MGNPHPRHHASRWHPQNWRPCGDGCGAPKSTDYNCCGLQQRRHGAVRMRSAGEAGEEEDNEKLPLDGFVWNPGFDPLYKRKPTQLPRNQVAVVEEIKQREASKNEIDNLNRLLQAREQQNPKTEV